MHWLIYYIYIYRIIVSNISVFSLLNIDLHSPHNIYALFGGVVLKVDFAIYTSQLVLYNYAFIYKILDGEKIPLVKTIPAVIINICSESTSEKINK